MGRAGSDLALETADAVIVRDELATVPTVVALSRRARKPVVQNLVIAGVFISGLAVWDLAGHLPLPLGVPGHEGSTVIVGLNGLRLLRDAAWNRAAAPSGTCSDMSRRQRRKAAPEQGAARPTVTACRGCCCGTPKIPRLDHEAQLADLRTSLAEVAMVRWVDCLDACDHANVIVVQPSAEGRPVWLGLVNDRDAGADITKWVEAGGPGLADPPDVLDLYVFNPSRRVRQELEC